MGKKKKFIEKKRSATFQLLARDSSDPNYDGGPAGDRVFVRVDNNQYPVHGFLDEDEDNASGIDRPGISDEYRFTDDPNSIFADAPGDDDDEEDQDPGNHIRTSASGASAPLRDHIRREILELGFPDDSYNYLLHLREIRNTGGGAAYYHNSKAKLDRLPLDIKAYDASRVRIPEVDDSNQNSLYSVAEKTVGVRIQRAVDPEVAALLDDNDSRFGSDVEDMEEDFVVRANLHEEGEDVVVEERVNSVEQCELTKRKEYESVNYGPQEHEPDLAGRNKSGNHVMEAVDERISEKPRTRRLLDEQFDLLELQEYGTDNDNDNDDDVGCLVDEDELLADKLNNALKGHLVDDLELHELDVKYKVPADFLHSEDILTKGEPKESAADVIRRCAEYAQMYENDSQDNEDSVFLDESSDESEVWDCETVISTYSNLDNHPGKIDAPEMSRKKMLAQTVSGALNASSHLISLRGKEKLPVEYLPHSRKAVVEKVKNITGSRTDQVKRKPHGKESKEEKKERKAAVKEERREARRAKKEMKDLYRCETQRAQKVAAVLAPSSIHLM